MPLVFGAIAPHGGDILEEIAANPAVMAKTRAAMHELGRRCAAASPDTVVVLTPHGMMVSGAISLGAAEKASGTLGKRPRRVAATYDTDAEFAAGIADAMAAQRLPCQPVAGRPSDPKAPLFLDLDWGAFIPLWYCARPLTPTPQIVVMAPDRNLPRETLVRCGLAIARAAAVSEKRIALIASCDQGHAHDAKGPYGYSPVSAEHDAAMCAAIAEDDLPRLLEWSNDFLEDAKVDAYYQTLILMGALAHTPMRGELLSYEAPTYFGMAVAAYAPP